MKYIIFTYYLFNSIICLTAFIFKNSFIKKNIYLTPKNDINNDNLDKNYNLNWHIIGESKNFIENNLYKITIFDNDYLVWKHNSSFYAMDNYCSHRGASLYHGKLKNNTVICPYHGYEFNKDGILCKVPGLNFTNNNCHNQNTYNVVELNDWIYLNIISKKIYEPFNINIYQEPEAYNKTFSQITLNVDFHSYGRIVSENSLDVMHIGFVHSFGNSENPSPITEIPPHLMNDYPYHFKTIYTYNSGKDSMAKKIFLENNLIIENEFILPHTTIARVKFGNHVSTIVTNTLPVNSTYSKLFIKTYRNFWNPDDDTLFSMIVNNIGNTVTKDLMYNTVMEDKKIIEEIKLKYAYGKFNMKYDKLQNVYRTLYKRLIHNINEDLF
jgi:phenylpropionate dioxygenase-like ring-hydroxylating dioxygenase large terminal subunit